MGYCTVQTASLSSMTSPSAAPSSSAVLDSSILDKSDSGPVGVYCIGGGNSASEAFDSFELLRSSTSPSWELSNKHMQLPRMSSAAAVVGSEIFVLGGGNGQDRFSSGEVFDVQARTWSAVSPMQSTRSGCSVVVTGSMLLVLGGLDGEQVYSSVEVFDTQRRQWHAGPPLCSRRFGLVSVAVGDELLAIGGGTGTEILSSVEVLPADLSGEWVVRDSWQLPQPRLGASAAVLHGKLYVVGGFNTCGHLNLADCFDPETQLWTTIAPLSQARSSCGLVSFGDRLLVCGGYDGTKRIKECEEWDPASGEWTITKMMQQERSGCSVVVAPL